MNFCFVSVCSHRQPRMSYYLGNLCFSQRLLILLRFSVFGFQGTNGCFQTPACSHAFVRWRLRDSNSRPPACKAGALPTELSPHGLDSLSYPLRSYMDFLLGLSGLEPPTSRLSGVRSNRLSYKPSFISPSGLINCNPAASCSPISSPI